MKKAKIVSVPAPSDSGYVWKWQDCDGTTASAQTFDRYFDCVSDARNRGYDVELPQAAGDKAPGGADFKLRDRNAPV